MGMRRGDSLDQADMDRRAIRDRYHGRSSLWFLAEKAARQRKQNNEKVDRNSLEVRVEHYLPPFREAEPLSATVYHSVHTTRVMRLLGTAAYRVCSKLYNHTLGV